MANVENLIGAKVVFTNGKGTQGNGILTVGTEYTVERIGRSGLGEGVVVEGVFVLAHGNYEVVKPEPIKTVREFLQAIYDGEGIVSVDGANRVDDTYYTDFENIASYEIENNDFYRKDKYDAYLLAVEAVEQLKAENVREELTYEEAIKELLSGNAVEVYVNGSKTNEYHAPDELGGLTQGEIHFGVWYKLETKKATPFDFLTF